MAGKDSEVSFPAHFNGELYELSLNLKDVGKEFLYLSGEYSISLIIGDPFIDNSYLWELGSVVLTFPPQLEVKIPDSVYVLKFVYFKSFYYFTPSNF